MKVISTSLSFLLASTISSSIFAGGLDLTYLYGSRYVGLGGAQVAITNDAYATFYNPSSMVNAGSAQLAFNQTSLVYEYGAPISANGAARNSDIGWAPLFFGGGIAPVWGDRLWVGFSVFPTALQGGKFSNVSYGAGNLNRELGNKLVRIEFGPSIAYKIVDHVSVGMSYMAAYTEYDKHAGINGSAFLDSSVSTWDAKDLKFGFQIADIEGFSLGFTYRLEQTVKMDGSTDVYTAVNTATYPTTQSVKIPQKIQIGAAYEFIPKKFTLALGYEFTENSVIAADTSTVTGITRSGFPSNTVTVPLHYNDGHTFHVGTEYVFNFSDKQKLSAQAGFTLDTTVTSGSFPIAALPPPEIYLGGALGAQYHVGSSAYGLAVAYGQYDKDVSGVDPHLAGISYNGNYSLWVWGGSFDYQYTF